MEWYRRWQRYARRKGLPIHPIPSWAYDGLYAKPGESNAKKKDTGGIPRIHAGYARKGTKEPS